MNEIKKPREKWYLAKLNPPDNAQCKKFAEFMRSQQDNPQIYPLEKDSIPEWKLRKNRIRKGFLSLMITCKEKKIVSSCSITPKKIWDGKNFLFGGEIVRGFMFAIMIGVVVGTYSSLFIASPIMFDTTKNNN